MVTRIANTANSFYDELKRINKDGVFYDGRIRYPYLRMTDNNLLFFYHFDNELNVLDIDRNSFIRKATIAEIFELYDDISKDAVDVVLLSQDGYESGYKKQRIVAVIHEARFKWNT